IAQAFHERAMRIAFAVGECVMLAVTGDPLLRDDRGAEPQPEAHRYRGQAVELHGAMCLRAMEEERDANVGDVTGYYDEQHRHPPRRCPTPEMRHSCTPFQEDVPPWAARTTPGDLARRLQQGKSTLFGALP